MLLCFKPFSKGFPDSFAFFFFSFCKLNFAARKRTFTVCRPAVLAALQSEILRVTWSKILSEIGKDLRRKLKALLHQLHLPRTGRGRVFSGNNRAEEVL